MVAITESPSGRLRNAVQECHERVDRSDYRVAVANARLPLPRYASFLRALFVLHDGLEQLVERSGAPKLREAFTGDPSGRERLERDLAQLQTDKYGIDAAALHALVLILQLRQLAHTPRGTASMLGAIYVVYSSQLGGLAQTGALSQRRDLQQGGLSYLQGLGVATARRLQKLFALLDESLQDEAELAAAIEGARHTFAGFEAILAAVMASSVRLAEALNFAAGAHPVPRDLREVHAALQAGEQSRNAFSYYEARYGERGRRFTRSDSAWLVTLSRMPEQEALRQVAWLGRLLAARGMPRLLLERHLEVLHAQLAADLPANRGDYQILQRAAHALAQERHARLANARFEQLCGELESACCLQSSATPPIPAREAGVLLVAAVVDEACGVPQAVESLCRWLTDSTRASQGFCTAVDHVLRTARAAL